MQFNPLSKHILFIVSVTYVCLRLSAISTNTVQCIELSNLSL